jgi:hypothetical protein
MLRGGAGRHGRYAARTGESIVEGISDIKIVGIDERRPPRIRKEPYIELYFRLSHKAPADWCQRFNALLSKHFYGPKIKVDDGLFIETWVRKPEEIEDLLDLLKANVAKCHAEYIRNIEAQELAAMRTGRQGEESDEQGRLNRIIAELNYD